RDRSAQRPAHRADALFDLIFPGVLDCLPLAVDQATALGLRQVLMTPRMRTDRVAGRGHLLEDVGLVRRMQADREEDRLGAMTREGGEYLRRVVRPRTVSESEHVFAGAQEIHALEVFGAEPRAAGGVDLDHAGNAERVRIARAVHRG